MVLFDCFCSGWCVNWWECSVLRTFTEQDRMENFRVSRSTFYILYEQLTPNMYVYIWRQDTQLRSGMCGTLCCFYPGLSCNLWRVSDYLLHISLVWQGVQCVCDCPWFLQGNRKCSTENIYSPTSIIWTSRDHKKRLDNRGFRNLRLWIIKFINEFDYSLWLRMSDNHMRVM